MYKKRYNKKMKRNIFMLFLSIALLSFSLLPYSLAWFASNEDHTYHLFNGHAVFGYFDPSSGNGKSADSPFIISEPKHFYNFAWLQNIGAFKEKTYLKIRDDIEVLDMAGFLSGENSVSGAIPPIGTSAHPFQGEFDGNGAVIKNLWVSSDENDWYEKPGTIDGTEYAVGTDIGLFGNIAYGANVHNFFLENIEVTNTVSNVNLGIIAGYVDGNISEIGVKNAKLTLETEANASIKSDYSLIGYKTPNVVWEDLPSDSTDGGVGGDLIINPTLDKTADKTNGTTNKMDIPGSVSGTAFYVGSLKIKTPKPNPKAAFLYTASEIKFNGTVTTYNANTKTATSINLNNPGNIESEFVDLMKKTHGDILAIFPEKNSSTLKPDFSAVTAVTEQSPDLKYPTNCIWFKPIAAGNCSIAFSRQSNNKDETMSIYRYRRNADGTILQSSKQEIILNFTKNNSLGNGNVAYFSIAITDDDVTAGYEYVIGASSITSDGTVGFIFLKLAGTDTEGGLGTAPDGNTYRMLKNIDFVQTVGESVNLSELKMYRSILTISGTQTGEGAIYYGATGEKVIYADNAAVSVAQKLTVNVEAEAVTYDEDTFPPRQQTKQSTA